MERKIEPHRTLKIKVRIFWRNTESSIVFVVRSNVHIFTQKREKRKKQREKQRFILFYYIFIIRCYVSWVIMRKIERKTNTRKPKKKIEFVAQKFKNIFSL